MGERHRVCTVLSDKRRVWPKAKQRGGRSIGRAQGWQSRRSLHSDKRRGVEDEAADKRRAGWIWEEKREGGGEGSLQYYAFGSRR